MWAEPSQHSATVHILQEQGLAQAGSVLKACHCCATVCKAEGRGQIRTPVPAPKRLPPLPAKTEQNELETALGMQDPHHCKPIECVGCFDRFPADAAAAGI